MEYSILLLLVCIPMLFVSLYFVRKQRAKVSAGTCPRCGGPLPMEEATTDGWACAKCGVNVDKYGRERNEI